MEVERFKYLYQQYQAELLTSSERVEWRELLMDDTLRDGLENSIAWFDISDVELSGLSMEQSEVMISQIVKLPQDRKKRNMVLWPRIAIAAAIAVVIFEAGLFYFVGNQYLHDIEVTYASDIKPGVVGATLTLADGRQLNLATAANAELAKEAGVTITKTANGRLVYKVVNLEGADANKTNTLSTANGETYQLDLPDGTMVWLNAESSVSFPASFASLKQRIVQLKGEAYLEVAKDRRHPFVVKTDRQDIQVLGTHFNVYAYEGEPTKTTLAEGSVRVSAGAQSKLIVPGQQAVVDHAVIQVEQVDLQEALAWKNGNFDFNNEKIEDIMLSLSRWYDIEVEYHGDIKGRTFSGNISRFKNISQVLRMLEKTRDVHFKIEGRRVIVTE